MNAQDKGLYTDITTKLSAPELQLNSEGQTHLQGKNNTEIKLQQTEETQTWGINMHLCHLQKDFTYYTFNYSSVWTQPAMNPGFYFTATGLMFIMVLANTYIIW